MTILQPICSTLNRWIDETISAEESARQQTNGHRRRVRGEGVRACGRINYAIWAEELHIKEDITVSDFFWLAFTYGINIICDIITAPAKIIVCKRRK